MIRRRSFHNKTTHREALLLQVSTTKTLLKGTSFRRFSLDSGQTFAAQHGVFDDPS
jgi:hypothetical protein